MLRTPVVVVPIAATVEIVGVMVGLVLDSGGSSSNDSGGGDSSNVVVLVAVIVPAAVSRAMII